LRVNKVAANIPLFFPDESPLTVSWNFTIFYLLPRRISSGSFGAFYVQDVPGTNNKISLKFVYYNMIWQNYIVSDKNVLLGKPVIKGTRISVELVLELFSAGWTEKQILESYPSVSAESLRAVFAYLKECIQQELYFPISA
jgi:uncharacterized protein (DUF433 family)